MKAMLRRFIAAAFILVFVSGIAFAQTRTQDRTQPRPADRAQATDFTVQLLLERSGELSPNIFSLEEFGVFNFSAQWKGDQGGKFSGFLVRVKLESVSKKEIFAQGRQAQFFLRDRKTKKVLRTWNISDIYVGDNGISYRAQFFTELDCTLMEAVLVSGTTRITRELACGE
jgi:hypothetical protein